MADKNYVVTAACAVVYNEDRSAAATVAQGGKVPPGADPEHLKLLLERGLIKESDESAGGLQVDPDAAPPFPGTDEESGSRSSRRRSSSESDS